MPMVYVYMLAQSKKKIKLMYMWHAFHWSINFFTVKGRRQFNTFLAGLLSSRLNLEFFS